MIRLLLCASLLVLSSLCELFTVGTSRGSVQGFDHDFGNDTSQRFFGYGQVFLGIPYGKAPLAERRFTLPEDICQYNDRGEMHNATYYRPRCWQTGHSAEPADKMSEDCLFLNVMTPNISGTYPVMVFIHGGTFTTGGADIYHWKGAIRNLVSRGIVVVTIQYRLGMLGFFTTFTETFPPNRGLYDQILALRWVKEEIEKFGGDSDKITIFGQSAGAVSVSDLSLSPLARGLFHQLILSSGSAYLEIETIDDPRGSISKKRAEQICPFDSADWGNDDRELLNCLLRASPQELVAFDFSDGKGWNAAIDGALLPDYPDILARTRPNYPTMLGDMMDDYSVFVPGVYSGDVSNITRSSVLDILRNTWPNFDEATLHNLTDLMINGYSNGTLPADHDHTGWTKLISDIFTGLFFSSNLMKDLQWHYDAGNEDVWLFTFAHRSLLPFHLQIDEWMPISHSSELPYLWFYPSVWETYNASASDFAVAEELGKMWTDFSKYGKLPYPKVGESMNYVEIDTLTSLKSNWRAMANEVFNEQIPNYLGEFPPLRMSEELWKKLSKLGEKVLSKWNSMKCMKSAITNGPTTSSGAPKTSLMALTMFMLAQSLRLMQKYW